MEEYDIPEPEDDFESRYEDELELLNDLDDDEDDVRRQSQSHDGPARKSLNFSTPPDIDKQPPDKQREQVTKNGLGQAMKRQIEEMYALLSSDSDNEESNDKYETDDIASRGSESQAKRARMSTSPEGRTASLIPGNEPTVVHEPVVIDSTRIRKVSRPKVFTRPPFGRDCIPLTGSGQGRRVYLALNMEESLEHNRDKIHKDHGKRPSNLLGVPFCDLKEKVVEQRRKKHLQESVENTETLNREIDDSDMQHVPSNEDDSEAEQKGLWVDKYSPKTYVELLSDDGINRNLLAWLKIWDPVVFGKEKPKKKKNAENLEKKEKFNKFNKDEDTSWMEPDATGRPVNKVALLCGPPGLGKTTLAHIVAQHAGYSVVEMNASDDRSVEVFRNKIESTTQMQSVLDSGKRPNCLIIDEIDGAPTPAINVLLSVIKKKDTADHSSGVAKKKKRKKDEILSRPIICICNDPYVPSLRQLRQQAFVLTFPPTLSGRLAHRLMQVSRKEVLQADMRALLALCEKAENDIRSCLNTLQFLNNAKQDLSMDYIQSANIGQKDSQKSLFSIWQSIFLLPRPKSKRLALLSSMATSDNHMFSGDTSEMTGSAARFYNMLHVVSSNGQYNKLENGLFENYLNMRFKDSHLNQVVSATEWLEFNDFIAQGLFQQQNFVLMRYQPFLSVAFHMFFAGPSQPRLSYPSTGYENSVKEAKMANLISTLLSDVSAHLRGMLDSTVIALELLPFLLHIITPTLRPINTQLFSESEKKQLSDLISTMIDYNVTYRQERTIEGQYSYILEPKVDDVVKFPGLPQHKQLTYATKQLIGREIDLEKMRRMERVMLRKNPLKEESTNSNATKQSKTKEPAAKATVVLDYKPKEIKTNAAKQQAKDFFGRTIVAQPNTNGSKDSNNEQPQSPFWFKFQEGFSNAVRRTIKIQDLL